MASLRARFHFRLRGLLVDPEVLGARIEAQRGRRTVTVVLPPRAVARGTGARAEADLLELFPPDDPAPTPTTASMRPTASIIGHSPVVQIDGVRVEVVTDSPISAADVRHVDIRTAGPDGQALIYSLRQLLDELYDVATEVVADLTQWARVQQRQHWLGIAGETPYGLGWGELVDLDANEILPIDKRIGPIGTIGIVEAGQVMDRDQANQLEDVLENPPRRSLGAALLADAFYYARDATPHDRPRGLLIATVACEVKIKEALRDRVPSEAAGLLELALRNTRPTVALFGRVCKEVTGHSLRDYEDGILYKNLGDLFRRRNDLAHHGEVPDDTQVHESLQAADAVFCWLDGLPS